MKMDFDRRDLHASRPFLPAKGDLYGVLASSKGYVGRRVTEEPSINVDFAAAR